MVKSCRNMNFDWILILQQEKLMRFDYCEKYLRSISNKMLLLAVLRRENANSVVIFILIKKKMNNVKEDPRRKTDANFDFFRDPKCAYEVFIRRNLM